MAKIYLGNLSAIEYLGEVEKEFTRSPFTPKPIVKQGDIIILEKIHAYNLSRLLPNEWKMWDKNYIEVREDEELLEIIAGYESELEELEAVVAAHDLKVDVESSNTTNEVLKEVLSSNAELNISPDEALEVTQIKPFEEFTTKEELETYALEEFGFELDVELSLEDMYQSLKDIVNSKEDEK